MPVNPNEAPEGYVAAEPSADKRNSPCKGCAFLVRDDALYMCVGGHACTSSTRRDQHEVIFIKKERA